MEIIKADINKITQVSKYEKGQWTLYSLGNFEFKKAGPYLSYCRPSFTIGLLRSDETDPNMTVQTSSHGEYLFVDSEGNLTLLPESRAKLYVP